MNKSINHAWLEFTTPFSSFCQDYYKVSSRHSSHHSQQTRHFELIKLLKRPSATRRRLWPGRPYANRRRPHHINDLRNFHICVLKLPLLSQLLFKQNDSGNLNIICKMLEIYYSAFTSHHHPSTSSV